MLKVFIFQREIYLVMLLSDTNLEIYSKFYKEEH